MGGGHRKKNWIGKSFSVRTHIRYPPLPPLLYPIPGLTVSKQNVSAGEKVIKTVDENAHDVDCTWEWQERS